MNDCNTHDVVSATEPDWSREAKAFWEWAPPKSLLARIRAYQRHRGSKYPWRIGLRKLATLRHRVWSIVTGADIPLNCHIEGGLSMPHPNGIVVHPAARIGPNCLFFQQVTIGTRNGGGAPTIGGHVDVGAGAKVLGAIRVEDHSRIGANAVVLRDVPTYVIAVGIPARILMPPRDEPETITPHSPTDQQQSIRLGGAGRSQP